MTWTDFHCHLEGPEQLPDLTARNDRSGIARTVLVSGNLLDPSSLADHMRGTRAPKSALPNNDVLLAVARSRPDRFVAFYTLDPTFDDADTVLRAIDRGFAGFKLNPVALHTSLTDPRTRECLAAIPPGYALYTHVTLARDSDLAAAEEIARGHAELQVVVGHMGFAGADAAALAVALRCDNLWLETSIGNLPAYRAARRNGAWRKLVFGSEYPAHAPDLELAKLKQVFDDEELATICGANARRLLDAHRPA